ncbi:MAG: hypothetical protein ACKOXP_02385 [Flavobacteriales bacterium]
MKNGLIIAITCLTFFACSKSPSACECGKNLMKSAEEQDQSLTKACEEHVATLPDSAQMNWYNQSMECMNEQ